MIGFMDSLICWFRIKPHTFMQHFIELAEKNLSNVSSKYVCHQQKPVSSYNITIIADIMVHHYFVVVSSATKFIKESCFISQLSLFNILIAVLYN